LLDAFECGEAKFRVAAPGVFLLFVLFGGDVEDVYAFGVERDRFIVDGCSSKLKCWLDFELLVLRGSFDASVLGLIAQELELESTPFMLVGSFDASVLGLSAHSPESLFFFVGEGMYPGSSSGLGGRGARRARGGGGGGGGIIPNFRAISSCWLRAGSRAEERDCSLDAVVMDGIVKSSRAWKTVSPSVPVYEIGLDAADMDMSSAEGFVIVPGNTPRLRRFSYSESSASVETLKEEDEA
jgi:hypothetical protein